MAAKAISTHGRPTCVVEVDPNEVDAGTELSVVVRVSCPHGCDLLGQSVSIHNEAGAELARAELAERDNDAYVTGAIVLPAPLEAREHIYQAFLSASDKAGVLHEETSQEFSFVALAHAASVNVWGLPSVIAAGERFSIKVGIKCSAGCTLTGRRLRIIDHEGAEVAEAALRDDVWPGTAALYFAEVEAQAPLTTGDYQWQVETAGSDTGVPHAAGACAFTVKVVRPPDHEVTVAAFDSQTQTPIKGAHVLLHPYRASTDEHGMAKVKVVKGTYTLFVSGFNYIAYEAIIDVTADITARAELTVEPEGQDDYR
jgi:hypothetical protein